MITDYAIICDTSATLFTVRVKAAIKDGWQPHGELIVSDTRMYQAMVKYREMPWVTPCNVANIQT